MNAQELADRFSQRLRLEMTVDEINQVIERNKAEANLHICHSHDFCDANVVMHKAMGRMSSEVDTQLWAQAWDLAKASEFKLAEYLAIERFVDSEWPYHLDHMKLSLVEELFYAMIDLI